MYHFFMLVYAASGVGVLTLLPRRRELAVLIAFVSAFVLVQFYQVLTNFIAHGAATSPGWYLYALASAEFTLLSAGLARWTRRLAGAAAVCFFALEAFAVHVYLLPYYTGMSPESANGVVRSFRVFDAGLAPWSTIFERLAVNKPAFVTPSLIVGWWIVWLAASAAAVIVCLWQSQARRTDAI
jgi:hypothetical protein